MPDRLLVMITKNEDELNSIVRNISGAGDVVCKRLWDAPQLGNYDGGGVNPLVLFGHANVRSFVRDWKDTDKRTRYSDGADVGRQLRATNVRFNTFAYCFIAGCSSAGVARNEGLFISLAQLMGIPTIGSTTDVTFSSKDNYYAVKPDGSGIWRVCYPDEGCYPLTERRCDQLRDRLASDPFRPV